MNIRSKMYDKFKNIKWTGGHICGRGSVFEHTKFAREQLISVIVAYKIKSIADIGAGDLSWISSIDFGDVKYTAYDLVPRHTDVIKFDITLDVAPTVDLIFSRYVLNHLSDVPELHEAAIKNIKNSNSKFLLMTTPLILKDSYIKAFGEPIFCEHEQIEGQAKGWYYCLWSLNK